MRFIVIKITILLIFLNIQLFATIVNTKHNLSISNTAGTIKAQTETEICVFCHVPHGAAPLGKPLWNRSMPTSNYIMYTSDYLKRLNYPEPTLTSGLGSANNTPGALSRQCLSCHDGTIAVGAVHKIETKYLSGQIAMNGVDANGAIPNTSTKYIGTNLTNHHPVGFEYNPNISVNFDVGTRPSELKDPPDSPIKLFTYGGSRYIECSSCHNPHTENKMFLRVNTGVNHGQNVKNTCISCHDKTSGNPTIHQVTSIPYTDAEVINKYGTSSPADLFCANCHTPHNGEGKPYLFRKVEQQTCFQGAGSSVSVTPCHGDGAVGGVNIERILNKQYAHPVNTIDGVHTNLDALFGYDLAGSEMQDTNGVGGVSFGTNKHAECMDCHNPHKTGKNAHVPANKWYPDVPTNAVSDVLRNVTGVEPIWPSEWTQPDTFSTLESSTKEYQICFKCHSYWGLGTASGGVSNFPSLSDPFNVPMTDVAWEMNINNKSGHPVVINANARAGTSYAPKALEASQLTVPWSNAPGVTTMYCSDCHGTDNEIGGDPKGPHGSSFKFMLKGENNFWPTKDGSTVLYDTNDIGTIGDTGLFCKNCHNLNEPHKTRWSRMTRINIACVECHVAIPHGSPISRLMGYSNFPAPYNYGGNSLTMSGFKKNALNNINRGDVASNNRACRCHGGGGGMGGGGIATIYDENLFP